MQLMTNPQEFDENGNPIPKPLAHELAALRPPPVVYPEPVTPAPPEPMPVEPVAAPMPAAAAPKPFDVVETTNTSTSTPVANPAETGTQLALDRDAADLKALVLEEGEVAREAALTKEAKAIADDAVAVESQARKEQYAAAIEAANKTADAEIDAQYKAQKDFKFKDYWESQSTGNKVLAAIAIGLGGLGAGMQGKDGNGALDIINNAITRDSERQKAEYAQLGDNLKASRDNKTNKLAGLENVEASFAVADAGKYDAALKKMEVGLAKQGVPVAEIATNKIVVGLTQKRNEELLKAQQSLRATRTVAVQQNIIKSETASAEKVSDGQAKARGLTSRAAQAVKEYDGAGGIAASDADKMRKHLAENYSLQRDATGLMRYVLMPSARPFPNGFSEKARLAWNAIREVADSSLRLESGAVVGDDEIKNRLEAILPTNGDTEAVVKQKRKRITSIISGMAQQVGNIKMDIPEEPAGSPVSAEDRAALTWAKANPNSPLAAQILKENGL